MPTLADTYTNTAGLRSALREAVGHPDQTVLLPDGTVDNACRQALDKLNADRPLIMVGTFATVAGQQSYTPLPAAAYGFRRVYWPLTECGCTLLMWSPLLAALSPYMTMPVQVLDESGAIAPVEPAAVVAVLRQHAWLRKLRGGGASIVEREVYLSPSPGSAQTVVFTYHMARYATFLSVADGDRQRFLDLVCYYLHTRLSVGAGAVTDVRDSNEGTGISIEAASNHLKQAKTSLFAYKSNRAPVLPADAFP